MDHTNNIAELIDRYLKNDSTQKQFQETITLLKDAKHHLGIYTDLSRMWEKYEVDETSFSEEEKKDLRQSLAVIHHQINLTEGAWKGRSSGRKVSSVLIRIAAVLLLPVMALSLWYFVSSREPYSPDGSYVTIDTPHGSKIRTELPDGTVVWQNSGSTLKYPREFTRNNRKVILTGEAFFDVTTDRLHPFYVTAGEVRIKVTGTRFNVSSYHGESTSVVLESGRITALKEQDGEISRNYELIPGDRLLSFPGKGEKIIHNADVEKYVSWIEGKLIFRDDPLEEILTRLGRWYNVDIEVNDPQGKFRNLPFTMTIENETLSQVLEYLRHAAPFTIREEKMIRREDGSFKKPRYIIEYRN